MCQFMSIISDGNGKAYYFNWKQRQGIIKKENEFKNVESADWFVPSDCNIVFTRDDRRGCFWHSSS